MAGPSVDTVSPAQAGASPSGQLAPQTRLAGGRYEIVRLEGQGAFGEIYRATDQQGQKPVSLRLIPPPLVAGATAMARLTKEIGLVAHMDHKNVCKTHKVGQDGGRTYLVADAVDGQSVSELILRKKTAGAAPFSLKGAYNIVAHICNALSYAHRQTFHGVLCSRNVFINKAGRIKIAEFGVARALPGVLSVAAQRLGDPKLFAPDLPSGAGDLRCDVYSVGAILYELVTGRTPGPHPTAPSQLAAGLDPQVDRIIATCMSFAATKRPRDIGQLKTALKKTVESQGKRPAPSGRVSAVQPAQSRISSQQPVAAGAIGVNEHIEKWLLQKNKMDYGPFSLIEVKKQIVADQFVMGNVIIDNDSGERCKIEKHALLRELVLEAHQRREERRRARAEVSAVTQSRRRGTALYVFIGVGVLALVGGGYLAVTALGKAKKADSSEMGSLGEAELAVTIKFTPQGKGRKGSRRGRSRRGKGGSQGGWDDSLDLGDVSEGGGSERLSNSQLNSVIQTRGGALGRCLMKSGERNANVEFIVKGNGKVSHVRVNGKTNSRAANCMRGVMKKMNFPSFNGPRTRGDFNMSL